MDSVDSIKKSGHTLWGSFREVSFMGPNFIPFCMLGVVPALQLFLAFQTKIMPVIIDRFNDFLNKFIENHNKKEWFKPVEKQLKNFEELLISLKKEQIEENQELPAYFTSLD